MKHGVSQRFEAGKARTPGPAIGDRQDAPRRAHRLDGQGVQSLEQRPARIGAVAQLGERLVRNEEASGSIPLSSTTLRCFAATGGRPLPRGGFSLPGIRHPPDDFSHVVGDEKAAIIGDRKPNRPAPNLRPRFGAVAQLGERLVRNEEASGSIPLSSTTFRTENPGFWAFPKKFRALQRKPC